MTKADLVEHIVKEAGITKADAEKALEALINGITSSLKKGERITLVGFGSFEVVKRAARMGRNPQTGAKMKIKASKVAKFRPGSALKNAIK